MDTSLVSVEDTDSLYLPTPQRSLDKHTKPITMPERLFIGSLTQLDKFVQAMNNSCRCVVVKDK